MWKGRKLTLLDDKPRSQMELMDGRQFTQHASNPEFYPRAGVHSDVVCRHAFVYVDPDATRQAAAALVVRGRGPDLEHLWHQASTEYGTVIHDGARLWRDPPAASHANAEVWVTLAMVCHVLRTELDRADGGDEPLCLRLPFAGGDLEPDALRIVSGTWCPSLSYCGDVRRELRSLWSRVLERTGGRLWVAAYDARSRFPWSERVVALARPTPMPLDQTECVICFDTYDALLPGPPASGVPRGPSGRWEAPSCSLHCL